MINGVNSLMMPFYGLHAAGFHDGPRGTNLLDSGTPYDEVYRCVDGQYVPLAPIGKKFRSAAL